MKSSLFIGYFTILFPLAMGEYYGTPSYMSAEQKMYGEPTKSGYVTIENNCHELLYIMRTWSGGNYFGRDSNSPINQNDTKRFPLFNGSPARIWAARTCANIQTLDTDECAQQRGISVAELRWDNTSNEVTGRGNYSYNISLAEGYNLPMKIVSTNASEDNCPVVECSLDILQNCPYSKIVFSFRESNVRTEDEAEEQKEPFSCRNLDPHLPSSYYARKVKTACPEVKTWSEDESTKINRCQTGDSNLKLVFC